MQLSFIVWNIFIDNKLSTIIHFVIILFQCGLSIQWLIQLNWINLIGLELNCLKYLYQLEIIFYYLLVTILFKCGLIIQWLIQLNWINLIESKLNGFKLFVFNR